MLSPDCRAPRSPLPIRSASLVLLSLLVSPAFAQSVFLDGFEAPVPAACSDPLIAPAGWDMLSSNWTAAWSSPDGSPQASYPNSVGFPVPIGTNKGKIKVINFTPLPNQTVDITWDTVQPNHEQGYYARPATSMFFAISPCGGDVRPPDAFSTDPWLQPGCRQVAGGGSMFFTTRPPTSQQGNEIVCHLEAGVQYFMMVAPINPSDGLTLGEHTCDASAQQSAEGCEVQATHRGY